MNTTPWVYLRARREFQDKQLIVALEGVDKTGKSEISKELSRVLGVHRFKASSESDTFKHHQDRFLQQLLWAATREVDLLRQVKFSIVYDRAWGSEYVYSKFFDRPTSMETLEKIDAAMAEMGASIVVCRRSSYEGFRDDDDPTIGPDELQKLDSLYDEFIAWTKCKTHVLYVDDEDLQREVKEVLGFLLK